MKNFYKITFEPNDTLAVLATRGLIQTAYKEIFAQENSGLYVIKTSDNENEISEKINLPTPEIYGGYEFLKLDVKKTGATDSTLPREAALWIQAENEALGRLRETLKGLNM